MLYSSTTNPMPTQSTTVVRRRRQRRTTTVLQDAIQELGQAELQRIWNNAIRNVRVVNSLPRWQEIFDNTDEFGPEEHPVLKQAPLDFAQDPEFNCWEYQGQTQNGYPVVSVRIQRNQSAKIQVHQLAILQKDWNDQQIATPGITASHTCHNSLCIRPDHLHPESIARNTSRNYCQCYIFYNGEILWVCRHEPPCLFPGSLSNPYDQ